MSWRDQYLQGSFRGVEFRTRSAGAQLGRRVVLHQYPGKDKPYAEDLGRQARQFNLDLYVLGDDYMSQRDKLRDALEQAGPGTLVHPWLGTMRVAVLSASASESTRDGGRASFRVTFAEAGDASEPADTLGSASAMQDAADAVNAQLLEDFSDNFDISGPEFLATTAKSALVTASERLEELSLQVAAPGSALTEQYNALDLFVEDLSSLVAAPGNLALTVIGLVQGLANLADDPLDAFAVYELLWDWGTDDLATVPQTTSHRVQQAANQAAITALVRRSAMTSAANQMAAQDYTSVDQAITLRDAVLDRLEEESLTADDDLYNLLCDLRAAVVADVDSRGADLPRIISYTPPVTLPALVLAYQIYGDPQRDSELIERNNIVHPGFVPGGTALEVLSDA